MSSSAPDRPQAPRRRALRVGLLLLAVAVLAGLQWAIVVGSPPKVDPGGVDGLTIPMTDPDPADFVDEVTNPWIPLRPGDEWSWTGRSPDGDLAWTSTVLRERVELAGLQATAVRTVRRTDGVAEPEVVRLYAEDREGNVWLVGREGVWSVADPGAVAGLAMPADPRRGDGWVREVVDGQPTERVRVGETDLRRVGAQEVAAVEFVELEVVPDGPDREVRVQVARGIGEVLRTRDDGGRLELASPVPDD